MAVACSSRNWPPQLPSLTHPGPRGSGDPQVFSSSAPPGLHTSSPGNCSSGSGPAARSSGTASLRSSPFSTGPGRSPTRPRCTSTPLPAPPAAQRPRPSHLYAAPDIRERETQPRLASLRPSPSAGDLRELARVPLRGEGSCGGGGAPRDSAGSGATEEGLTSRGGMISFRIDWFDSLQSKGLSRVFSNTTVQKQPGLPVHHQLPEFAQTHIH